jgi:prepilin-type N-terminal cleavage/methylation domain-containing protein
MINKNRIQGFTLIELMVSLLLGSILILGIFNLLINTNTLSRTTKAGNDVQEAGRFAMAFLSRNILSAGSRRIDSNLLTESGNEVLLGSLGLESNGIDPILLMNNTATKLSVSYPDGASADIPIATTHNPAGSGNAHLISGDTLAIQYFPSNRRGCDGKNYADPVINKSGITNPSIVNLYWARSQGKGAATKGASESAVDGGQSAAGGVIDDTSYDALYCVSMPVNATGVVLPTAAVSVLPLVIGVQAMEVKVRKNDAGAAYEDPSATLNGRDISDVRVGLLIRSRAHVASDIGTANLQTKKYELLGTEYEIKPSDGFEWYRLYRQVYTVSAQIINQAMVQ